MSQSNPIEKELAKLTEQWHEFIDSDLAILHWKVPQDAMQLVNTFIKVKEQFDEKNPDFFIHLTTPFNSAKQFGSDLTQDFLQAVEEGLDDSAEEGEDNCGWQKPDLSQVGSGFQTLFTSCSGLLEVFGDYLDSLVLVIAPQSIVSEEEYKQWWSWACNVYRDYDVWHEKLKLVVFDLAEQPFLEEIIAANPDVAMSLLAPLDYRGALNEVLDEANDGSDGAKIRQCILDMNYAITEQDKNALDRSSSTALPIALNNAWFDISATILITRASGYLNWQMFDLALQDFREAQKVSIDDSEVVISGCEKLLLQAMLNEGTTLFLSKQLGPAAKVYHKTAGKAQELNDLWICIEAWRMGSFCLEQNNDLKHAWDFSENALKVGYLMDEEQRAQSSLPFVGQALIRMSPNGQVTSDVDNALGDMIGSDWQQVLKEATS